MTTYLVDVFRTYAQVVKIEADNAEQALTKVDDLLDGLAWSLDNLTDDVETAVCGEINAETGDQEYY
jgi:hypothetical protein